ncbi:glycosyl transferase family protein [Paenibacillus thiaminolyticus]|nr:glycosyl transferase family protein [Paenibacillus thiaminolyticus]
MARVLYVTIPAEGHVNATIGLVKQLVDNGEEVVYMCSEQYRSRLARTGAQFRAYQIDETVFRELVLIQRNILTRFTSPILLCEALLNLIFLKF